MYDSHIHTNFSPDGKMTVDEAAKTALGRGLSYIAITDHADFIVDKFGRSWDIENTALYNQTIENAKNNYNDLYIARGLEAGYAPKFLPLIKQRIEQINPEFVIGSAHLVNGSDPYYKEHYLDKDKETVYREYLIYMRKLAIDMKGLCDVVGHFDYIVRYAPYDSAKLDYEDFPELIDAVLDALIESGIGLEINTSNLRRSGDMMPPKSILNRYRQRGGEIVTIGSDAHEAEHIAAAIANARLLLKESGFNYQAVFKNRRPEFIKL